MAGGGTVVYLLFFALVMGYLVIYCVFSVSFLVWLFRSVLVSPVFFFPFLFLLYPFIPRFSFPFGLYTIHELIGRSVDWLVGTVRYDINWNLMYLFTPSFGDDEKNKRYTDG